MKFQFTVVESTTKVYEMDVDIDPTQVYTPEEQAKAAFEELTPKEYPGYRLVNADWTVTNVKPA